MFKRGLYGTGILYSYCIICSKKVGVRNSSTLLGFIMVYVLLFEPPIAANLMWIVVCSQSRSQKLLCADMTLGNIHICVNDVPN